MKNPEKLLGIFQKRCVPACLCALYSYAWYPSRFAADGIKLNWTEKADIIVMRLAIWNGMRQCWHVSSAEIIPVITTFCHFFFKFVSFCKKTFQSCSLLLSFFSHNIDFSDQRSLVIYHLFFYHLGGRGLENFGCVAINLPDPYKKLCSILMISPKWRSIFLSFALHYVKDD